MDIGYLSEPIEEYVLAIDGCKTLEELRIVLESYREIAHDALLAIPKDDVEFAYFLNGLRQERKGKFSGGEWMGKFGSILFPGLMMDVQMVAFTYKAPWGAAFIRLQEAGVVRLVGGVWVYGG